MSIQESELDDTHKFDVPTFLSNIVAMEDDKHEAEDQCENDYRYSKSNSDESRRESTQASLHRRVYPALMKNKMLLDANNKQRAMC